MALSQQQNAVFFLLPLFVLQTCNHQVTSDVRFEPACNPSMCRGLGQDGLTSPCAVANGNVTSKQMTFTQGGLAFCSIYCLANPPCAGFNYFAIIISGSSNSSNGTISAQNRSNSCEIFGLPPTRYKNQSGCSYYQPTSYSCPQTCADHLMNGYQATGVYTIFKFNPLQLFDIYCFMPYAPWTGIPMDCADLLARGNVYSGMYDVKLSRELSRSNLSVYCDMSTDYGGWTLIQQRLAGSIDFNRTWSDYTIGFGSQRASFWMGTSAINTLTANSKYAMSLRIDISYVLSTGSDSRFAVYSNFSIGNVTNNFRLHVSNKISGNAADALSSLNGKNFSTYDHNSAVNNSCVNCCGGWWYDNQLVSPCTVCPNSSLNGPYPQIQLTTGYNNLIWSFIKVPSIEMEWIASDQGQLSSDAMKIRPQE